MAWSGGELGSVLGEAQSKKAALAVYSSHSECSRYPIRGITFAIDRVLNEVINGAPALGIENRI